MLSGYKSHGVVPFKLVPNDTTEALLRDWEVVRQRIADGETRAFAFVEVKKDMSFATMWAKPESSNLVDNVLTAGVQVLLARIVSGIINESVV